MEKRILRPNGDEYMTVYVDSDTLEFRNFSKKGMTIKMDVKVLDQMVPFLNEVLFWQAASND